MRPPESKRRPGGGGAHEDTTFNNGEADNNTARHGAPAGLPGELQGLDEQALDRASAGDSAWFKRHRDRAHRIRPATPGELPAWGRPSGPGGLVAIVAQVRPGQRVRVYTRLQAIPCGCEACARDLWSLIAGQRGAEVQMALAVAGMRP